MNSFLARLLDFDRFSFWLGFLAATLFWWLLARLRPIMRSIWESLQVRRAAARLGPLVVTDIQLRNAVLQHVQSLHLAAPLCPLDEILILPQVLAPPLPDLPDELPAYEDITTQTIPYLPDWPELGSRYGVPRISLEEALSGGANLLLIGPPGSGKTTALAAIAARLARQVELPPHLEDLTPLWLPAVDFIAALPGQPDPLTVLAETIIAGAIPSGRRLTLLQRLLAAGHALLLIDQADELSPSEFDLLCTFIKELLAAHPSLRVIVAASDLYASDFLQLDFALLAMAVWDRPQELTFLERWQTMWRQLPNPTDPAAAPPPADPVLLHAWLAYHARANTPFEWTLKAWSVFSGDSRGPTLAAATDAYLRRLAFDPQGKPLVDTQAILRDLAVFQLRRGRLLSEQLAPDPPASSEPEALTYTSSEPFVLTPAAGEFASPRPGDTIPNRIRRQLPELAAAGLLRRHPSDRYTLTHSLFAAYLAGFESDTSGLEPHTATAWLSETPAWSLRHAAIGYWLPNHLNVPALLEVLERDHPAPTRRPLLSVARALGWHPPTAWGQPLLRVLARWLQDAALPFPLRARALIALVTSGYPNLEALLERLAHAPDQFDRQLAALGLGLLPIRTAPAFLIELLRDRVPNVRRAACLALVASETPNGMEAVAEALLHGDDDLRRAAAESFANHPLEGHPTLEEGSRLEDLLVRRAVVYGLRRIPQNWARQRLEQLQVEDEQWVVKNAANDILEAIKSPNPFIPAKSTPLSGSPWLIAFAAEHGAGLSPGTAPDMFNQALRTGNEAQQLVALQHLQRYPGSQFIPLIYPHLASDRPDLRAAAYQTLWHLELTGAPLPAMQHSAS